MKIRHIYFKEKRIPIVSIIFVLLCLVITIISAIVPSTAESFMFRYPIRNPWQFVTYVFQHYMPQSHIPPELGATSLQYSIGHFVYNSLLVLPFGILIEKVIGSKKYLILNIVAWILDVSFIYIIAAFLAPEDAVVAAHGASGLAFSFMPVGVYTIFALGKKFGFLKLFKQVLFYFLMLMALLTLLIALSPSVAGATEIFSMLLHLTAVLAGIAFAFIYHKTINKYFDEKKAEE